MANNLSTPVDFGLLNKWNEVRKIKTKLKSVFDKAFNSFSFIRPASEAESLHIYFGYDDDNDDPHHHQIKFTIIDSVEDLPTEQYCNEIIPLPNDDTKKSLEYFTEVQPGDSDQISVEVAIARINNWKDKNKRDSWIDNSFNEKNEILQVYSVQKADTSHGQTHICYLALKEDEGGNYFPDLIIVNADDNTLLNVEDIVYPVPPFKPNENNPVDAFGLLKQLV